MVTCVVPRMVELDFYRDSRVERNSAGSDETEKLHLGESADEKRLWRSSPSCGLAISQDRPSRTSKSHLLRKFKKFG